MSFAARQRVQLPSKQQNSSKPFKKFFPHQKVQSVQHRLETARVHRPVRPDLDSMFHAHKVTEEELAEGFGKLGLDDGESDDDRESTQGVDNNQNELSFKLLKPKRLKLNTMQRDDPAKAAAADELFFRLSRGIKILPEGLAGLKGMATPLTPNNYDLRQQIDKHCAIQPPWTTEKLEKLPECICFRNVLYSRCLNCDHVMKGRVFKNCERHPNVAYLIDYFFCYECLAETDQLREL